VFDLDDTLFDCLGQCVGPAHAEAARAMVAAGLRADVDEVLRARRARAGREGDVDALVAGAFPCADRGRAAEAGRRAFLERDPGPVTPHPFAREVLHAVRRSALAFLVTTGSPATQRRKLERLGLAGDLDEVLYGDAFAGTGKRELIAGLLDRRGIAPAETLVVGDRPASEIRAALDLGCRALRILAGEFAAEPTPPGVPEAPDVRAVLAWLPAGRPPTMLDAR
jgi:FMN phosphatase YigB (HAD superfamily)